MDKRGYNAHKRFCIICKGESAPPSPGQAGDIKHTTAKQTQNFVEERANPDKVVETLIQNQQETVSPSQHKKNNKKNNSAWRWVAAGVGSVIVICAGILIGGKKNV